MPELPDVQVYKEYMDATSLHQKIEHVDIDRQDLLGDVSTRSLLRRLKGKTFESTMRHGKNLFVEISDDGWLVLHFGMTGRLHYADTEQPPEHTRLLVRFEDGSHLAYVCTRMLGLIDWSRSPEEFIQKKELGIDALSENLALRRFHDIIGAKRGTIKSALMDQQAVAGLGNVYVDEILFQAMVHPRTKVAHINKKTMKQIFRQLHRVLKSAIKARVVPKRMPKSFMLPHRGDKDQKCPRCHASLDTIKISARTTWFCPQCQQLQI